MTKILIFMLLMLSTSVSDVFEDELTLFLYLDKTNEIEYRDSFDCTDFGNALMKNASEHGITLGAVWLFDNFSTGHIINYVYINDSIMFIEPMTDEVLTHKEMTQRHPFKNNVYLSNTGFKIHRLLDYFGNILYCWWQNHC